MEQIGAAKWRRFIEDHPLASVYHHDGWHTVIEKTYGYKADYCVVYGEGRIEAALPFVRVSGLLKSRLVAYPYSDACDPLVTDSRSLGAVMQKLEELRAAQRIPSAELRTYRLMDYLLDSPFSGDATYCNYVLDLSPDAGKLFRSFHKDCVQRAIKKAQRSSVEVTEGTAAADLKAFYRLHTDTRRRLGAPVQPFRFFKNLWEILHPAGVVSLLLARENGQSIAGVVQLKFKDTVYYKFAASDRRRLANKPNHLIIWRMIEDAQREGYRYLDFGRTFSGDGGLMQWKARWGAARHDFRYVYPADAGGNKLNREGNRVNMVLSGILKRLPAFMIRASGELFYRYLA